LRPPIIFLEIEGKEENPMEEKRNQRKRMMGKWGMLREPLAVLLVLALMAPVLEAKARRGAEVVVTKGDGTVVRGELLAVKGTDLVIMEGSTSAGITASLADVKSVKVVKKSKILKGLGEGFLIGGVAGAGLGAMTWNKNDTGWFVPRTRGEAALMGGIAGGVFGGVLGVVFGAVAGVDEDIVINATSPIALGQTAAQLRRLARDRG
jgi:hypothetical protein